jgi:predicted RND superfamily exporter protein
MRRQLAEFRATSTSRTRAIYGVTLLFALAIFGAFGISGLQTQYSIMQFLPEHHPAIKIDQSVRAHFHLQDLPTFVGILSLSDKEASTWLETGRIEKLRQTTELLKSLSGVETAVSLGNIEGAAETDGVLNIGPLLKVTAPEKWRQRILQDVLLTPSLISHNAKTVSVYVQLQNADVKLLVQFQKQFRSILTQAFPNSQVSIGGVPAVQTDLGLLLNKELVNFILLTILACAVTLFFTFHTFSTIFIPLFLTAIANVMVFAMMAWTGMAFTILSATIPILVFITVVSLSVHFLLRVNEEAEHNHNNLTRAQLIWSVHKAIWLPNFLGALTSCAGFLTLLMGDVPLIRNYGVAVAASVMLAWLLTSVGIIPLMILFPLPLPRYWVHRPARWALWACQNAKPIVGVVVLTSIILAISSRHLNWTAKLFDDLPENQNARRSTEFIDSQMGGVIPLQMVLTNHGDHVWSEPSRIKSLDQLLVALRATPGIGSANSLPDFFHSIEHLEHPLLPDSRKSISDIYFLYSLSDHNPIDNYLTDEGHALRIDMRLHDLPSNEVQILLEHIKSLAQQSFANDKIELGGMGAIVHIINDELSVELIFGFWQALLVIVILLAFIFRSLRWAIIACIPNLAPPIALLGYLSLTHTPIKPGTAIIFSIALGLAFNNTVYLLNRLTALKNSVHLFPVRKTFYLEGNPCLVSTLIMLVGFSVFLFSYFSINQTFGACMMVSIIGGIIGDLFFLPAFLFLWPESLGRTQMKLKPTPIAASEA